MPENDDRMTPPRSFWAIAGGSLLWNLIGVMNYLYSVTLSPEALAAMNEAERAMYADMPVFVTSSYAIAVFAGTLGSALLLMRKALSVTLFLVSLLAIILQMGFGLFLTPMLEAQGIVALILPIIILALAGFFLWYSRRVTAHGLLN